MLSIKFMSTPYDIALRCTPQLVNIGSGNGLVSSGNRPLPEPMLTQSYVAIWRH